MSIPSVYAYWSLDEDFSSDSVSSHLGEERTFDAFTPTTHITEQLSEDKELLDTMRPLFFERRDRGFWGAITLLLTDNDPDTSLRREVYKKAINDYDGQEIVLLTQDDHRISSLFFERSQAPLNILYVAGYFRGNTPSKEWAAPFSLLFPEYNVLSFDWRGYGESEGEPKNFDCNAYLDIQAAIDFLRKTNDKPIVVVGFCLGAALALKAEIEAQEMGSESADAFVISCTPTDCSFLQQRSVKVIGNWLLRTFASSDFAQTYIVETMLGDLADLKPLEMIQQINKPMLFEYLSQDVMVPLEEGIENFMAAPTEKKMITFSDIGHHVRIHTAAPYQYRQTFQNFVELVTFSKKRV